MPRLRPDDVAALGEATQEAYRAESAAAFPALAMRLSSGLVPCDTASFNDVDPSRNRAVAAYDPPDFPFAEGVYWDRFLVLQSQHPVIRYITETGDGSAMKISDFLDREAFHSLDLYREVYAPIGVEHQMAVTMLAPLPRIVAIVLSRSASASDFDERDRTVLNLLRPHLAQAYEHVRVREALTDRFTTLSELLRGQGSNVIFLGDVPMDATPGALTVLYRFFGPPAARSPFPERVARWIEEQRGRMDRRDDHALPVPFRPLTAVRDGRRIVARFVPGVGHLDTLVLTTHPEAIDPDDLRRLGLSPREVEVLRMLSTGATNAAIGQRLHIAAGTVKKHLDNIYRKLGVTGRVQAVSMSLDLLPPKN